MFLSRRRFLKYALGTGVFALLAGLYSLWLEPRWRLTVKSYDISPQNWPKGLKLTIAIVADIHACDPFMPLSRVREIVERTNALGADMIVLLGDYCAGHRFVTRRIPPEESMPILAGLKAPLGRYAILGNHDYWDGIEPFRAALAAHNIPLLENDVVRVQTPTGPFWLAGTASIVAIRLPSWKYEGLDDLPGTLEQITDDAPVILLAHEPDLFVKVPERVSLTLSGHTHGGQVKLPLIGRPVTPSAFGQRFAYGHIIEDDRHMIVSGGLGTSIVPARFGVPPEITVVRVS